MSGAPRVSIGLPVYNGAETVGETIRALLGQTLEDFELIVGDNASTDATEEVVRKLARDDPRIRYVRHSRNLGANGNFSEVARLARGEFLKWAAAGDWCHPTFLERCVDALDGDPDAVLAVPRTRLFVDDLSDAEDYAHDVELLDESPYRRLRRLVSELALNNAMNGVVRTSALRRTRLIEAYHQADVVLMGRLALLGKFLLVDEPLFYRQMDPATATALRDPEGMARHHYPELGPGTLLQSWKMHAGWIRAVASAPVGAGERLRSLAYVLRMALWNRSALARDLGDLVRYGIRTASGSATTRL